MYVFINWLRGIAALMVLYFHLDLHVVQGYPSSPIIVDSWRYWFVYGAVDLGKIGLALFFMVSGFLIPTTLRGQASGLVQFATHRAFRLYPAYWFAILIYSLITICGVAEQKIGISQVFINLTMVQKFVGVKDVIGAFWTLQIELIFYAFCATIFFYKRINRLLTFEFYFLLCIALCAAGVRHSGVYPSMPLALFIALPLMLCGDAMRRLQDYPEEARQIKIMISTMIGFLIPLCMLGYGEDGMRYLLSYWIGMALFIIFYVMRMKINGIVYANGVAQFLANCSYSIYLLHDPIGMTIGRFMFQTTNNACITIISASAITLVTAYIVYRCIEEPAIRYSKNLRFKRIIV